MRIKVHQTDGTLPFIQELPDYGIGQLEGYNGVGKSLTVSVLEICGGVRPRMEAQAWRGLCEGMGRLTVIATELRGVSELKWVLDGATLWDASHDADDAAPPQLDWFVDIQIDDRPAQSLDDIRALFAVERVNGDVGLVEQLAGRAEAAMREVDSFAAPLLGSGKLESVEQAVGDLRNLLDELSTDRIADRAEAAAQRRGEREDAEAVMRRTVDDLARIEELAQLRTRLDDISVRGAELDAQIASLNEQIEPLDAKRREVGKELNAAEALAVQSEDVRAELAKATRRYKTASTRLRNVTRDLAKASQVAEIDDDDDPTRRRAELERQLEELRRQRIEVDAGPAVTALIDEVNPRLTQAAAAGLVDQSLLSAPSRAPSRWTVGEVVDAMGRRRDELGDVPSPRDAQRIDENIELLTVQLRALQDVEHLRTQRANAAERQNDAQQRSHELGEMLDASTTARLDELRDARRALDDQLSDLGAGRAVLAYRRDSLGAPQERDVVARRLAALLAELQLDENEVESAYADALREAEEAREAYARARDAERGAVADHERDIADVHRTVAVLRDDDRYSWLAAVSSSLSNGEGALNEKLDAIAELQRAVRDADSRLTAFRQVFPGLRASLGAVADELRGRPSKAQVRVREVFDWLEHDAIEWFSDDAFRQALLGDGAEDVAVDLRSRQVSWSSGDQERHTKPIEALSSGERAFAFTQARLALLQQRAGNVANRLIALDEFGAFVSANRISQLADYLRRWRDAHETDQILVILPANQDYEALERASDGAEAERYARMANALREQEWFVEEFDF